MADAKISALPASTTPLAGTEVLPIVQSSTTKRVSVANLTAGRTVQAGNLEVAGYSNFSDAVNVLSGKLLYLYNPASNNYWSLSEDSGNNFLLKNVTNTVLSGSTAGNVTVGFGNVVIGTAGKGIDFSANTHAAGMTSELLTWYEEGTWTPTLGGTWTANPINLTGSYTRVGNVVYLQLEFTGGTKATALSGWFTGVPFNIGKRGTGQVVDDAVTDKGGALFANTNRVWVTGTAFSGANIVTGFYMV